MFSILVEALGLMPPELLWIWAHMELDFVCVMLCAAIAVLATVVYAICRLRPVFLVDYACFKPSEELVVPLSVFMGHSEKSGIFDDSSLEFQRRILERSGLGERTYFPPAMFQLPPKPTMAAARTEAEQVMFGALDSVLERTGVKPMDIDILVVNCSLFNPTPSLSATIVNRYKLRNNIRSFNLGGMGCSAGVISIGLARDLLQKNGSNYAMIVSMENITQNWYFGNQKSMLIPNCLFRMGGAAILLSNKGSEGRRAKYKLVYTVRTHKGADDKAFNCVLQQQDEARKTGVSLSKDLMTIAGEALKANISTLGPLVLPVSEQLLFFAVLVARKVLGVRLKPYVPNFQLAFEHFCVHAGGRAVIEELEKNLHLSPHHVEASRMTLHRFGNTSSSSIWYELAYTEAKGRVQKGHRVWQIAFGSGFKCNSAVWQALRNVQPQADSPWADVVDNYPVVIPEPLSS